MFRRLFGKRDATRADATQRDARVSSSDEKVACSKCGKLILKRMAALNDGKCTACTTTSVFDAKHYTSSTLPAEDVSPMPAKGTMTAMLGVMDLFVALRSQDVQQALTLASNMRTVNPNDPLTTFLEGVLTYSMRDDAVALERFRKSMEMEPLFAEVPYYIGQILVESAIDDYKRSRPGSLTAEMALRWAGTYDAALTAFARAETVDSRLNLKSISDHLSTYKNLLGTDRFSNMPSAVAQLPSEKLPIEDGYTTPDRWLFAIGSQYNEQQFERREMLVDLITTLASEPSIVFVVGRSSILSPISMLLSRRKGTMVFEVGPGTPDDILKGRLSTIKGNIAILTDLRRIGFGKYFSWMPLNAEVLEIILINPQSFLSVEFLGLLARLQCITGMRPIVHFTLVTLVQDSHI